MTPTDLHARYFAPGTLKTCSHCAETKPVSEYQFKNQKTGKLKAHCTACNRLKQQAHYRSNPEQYVQRAARNNERYRERNQALRDQALEGQHCSFCGTKEDLTFYSGPDLQTQPVHMAVHSAVSQQAVLESLGRATVVCRGCLGNHFAASGLATRLARRQADKSGKEGAPARPRGYYKRYRSTQLNNVPCDSDIAKQAGQP